MTVEPTTAENRFLFIICQNGAEAAARAEIMQAHPNLRLAFSPGFVTFKVDPEPTMPERFVLKSTLARTAGWSIAKLEGSDATQLAKQAIESVDLPSFDHLHVWQRDPMIPGSKGFEPGISPLAEAIGQEFSKQLTEANGKPLPTNRTAKADQKIFDVILVEPNQWWIGYHFATTVQSRWPGGVPVFDTTKETISRAYWKAKEALMWSGITLHPGDVCAEIGSAPGGCCELLLEMGAQVIGIDPAEMEPVLLENKNLTHIRRRGHEVKKKDLKDVKWLFADVNVVPKYTLDSVSEIINNANVHVKGMVLTLKLTDWKLIEDIPALIEQVRSLGFSVVKTRQLAFNRREFCLVGVKDKFVLRSGRKKTASA